MVLLIAVAVLIALKIMCDLASTIIYYLVIRKVLRRHNVNVRFGWLAHKQRRLVSMYRDMMKYEDTFNWGDIVFYLEYASWLFLIIACLIASYMVVRHSKMAKAVGFSALDF